jgi:Na+-transporting methylmalonyl-CoA/oxaloacetate decarboxylase gamma subunit
MAQNLTTTLWITLVGMGLVFGAIVLFWGTMACLVRLVGGQATAQVSGPEQAEGGEVALDRRRRAALVAVSVALALEAEAGPKPFPFPPPVVVNTWQSVNRARLHGRRGVGR